MQQVVHISCKDGKINIESKKQFKESQFLNKITNDEISLQFMTMKEFENINEYLIHIRDVHNGKSPLLSRPIRKPLELDEYEKELYQMALDDVYRYIEISNKLEISSLFDLLCARVASEIIGLKASSIRLKFDIQDDFTLEEKAKINEYFDWTEIFDK